MEIDETKLPENICGECMEDVNNFVFFITCEVDDEEYVVNFCEPCSKNLMRGKRRRGKD